MNPTDSPASSFSLFRLVLGAAIVAGLYGGAAWSQPMPAAQQGESTIRWTPGEQGGWGIRAGYQDDYRQLALVYDTPRWWSHQSQSWGRLDLNAELGITYWHSPNKQPDSMWQASATPMLRWWPNDFFYVEAGVGLTAVSRTTFADRRLGSSFQFGDHIGVGTVLGDAHRIGLRYSHFSNAGLKEPNDGLDVVQLTYTYQF